MKNILLVFVLSCSFCIANAGEIKVALACSSACESYRMDPDCDNDPRVVIGGGI